MNMKIFLIKVFPNHGNPYYVTFTIDNIFDEEEPVNVWVKDNLKRCCLLGMDVRKDERS